MKSVTKMRIFVLWMTGVTLPLISSQNKTEDKILDKKYNACECKNSKTRNLLPRPSYAIEGDADESLGYRITCCAKEYIGTNEGDFNVTWSFSGEETPYSTLRILPECFGQVSSTNRVDVNEAGNHSCTITTRSGISFTKLVKVKVHVWKSERATLIAHNVSNTVYTDQGSSVTLNCTYYLGKGSISPDVYWRKYWLNDSGYFEQIASTLGYTEETYANISMGNTQFFVFQLRLLNITEDHFGNYCCKAITASSIISQNITVIEGMDSVSRAQRQSRIMLISAISCLVMFLVIFEISFRYRYFWALKWKKLRESFKDPPSGFYHDIFVIHGPSASFWVYGTLMEKLEGQWSYDCFSPERDLLGGEAITEVICQKLGVSRQIIVVVSDCLLHSQWCSYVTLHAIHRSLTNSTTVIAITLTDLNDINRFPEGSKPLVNILKAIRKIPYPLDFSPMKISSHINGNAFGSDQLNATCKTKCAILIDHSINNGDNISNKEATDKQQKCVPNSSSSPNMLLYPNTSHFSTSSSSLPSLFLGSNTKCTTTSISKILPSHTSSRFKTKHIGNSELKSSGQFLHSNMILGSLQIRLEDTATQENQQGHVKELADNDDKSKESTKQTEPESNFKTENSENLGKDYLPSTKVNFSPIKNSEIMSAKHLEDIEICTPLNELSQYESHNQRKKRKRNPIMALISAEPTEIFWQKLRLHLPIRRKGDE